MSRITEMKRRVGLESLLPLRVIMPPCSTGSMCAKLTTPRTSSSSGSYGEPGADGHAHSERDVAFYHVHAVEVHDYLVV